MLARAARSCGKILHLHGPYASSAMSLPIEGMNEYFHSRSDGGIRDMKKLEENFKSQNLAQSGEGIKECEVIEWFVKPGDTVKEFDRLCHVQSDKATIEVTSCFSGIVESIKFPAGSIAQVGDPLLFYKQGSDNEHQEVRQDGAAKVSPDNSNNSPKMVPLSGYRRSMMNAMQNASMIPHCYAFEEVNVGFIKQFHEEMHGETSFKILPYAMKAIAQAIKSAPMMNGKLRIDDVNQPFVEIQPDVNIGIAIATTHGLAVPNVKNVGNKGFSEIVSEIYRLKKDAECKTLTKTDTDGSSISISNIGTLGGHAGLATIKGDDVS